MNRVITNIGIIRYILNSKYKVISIELIMRFHERMIMNIEIIRYISNSKYKVITINLIMRFHESRDFEYWNYMIYFKFKI